MSCMFFLPGAHASLGARASRPRGHGASHDSGVEIRRGFEPTVDFRRRYATRGDVTPFLRKRYFLVGE